MTQINSIHIGEIQTLEPEGQSTGIYKYPVNGKVFVNIAGIEGDHQADKRFHGGPEKAIHHYAGENYDILSKEFPGKISKLIAGSLGENLSTVGLIESNVCIGDIIKIGDVQLQVSQPRTPCWKINHKFDEMKLSRFIHNSGLTGWYYRVLKEGNIQSGQDLELVERYSDISIDKFWGIINLHRPKIDDLLAIENAQGLNPGWQERIRKRREWLQARN